MLTTGSGATLQHYQYDAFNMMTTVQSITQARGYVYTADDERMVEFDFAESPWVETWTIRGLDKKVLRQWKNEGGEWLWSKDYIYRGSQLLASEEPEQGQHLHLDHLGTPRLITSSIGGGEIGRHTYFPFGEEVTDAAQDGERMKFTGHERDLGGAGGGDDLDYMHARYFSPSLGRFLSVDRKQRRRATKSSQIYNRYGYSNNSPISFLDPDGRDVTIFFRFTGNSLSQRQQSKIMQNVRSSFVNSGIRNVRVLHDGTNSPRVKGKHKKFTLEFVSVARQRGQKSGNPVLGRTPLVGLTSQVSTESTLADPSARIIQISNTAAHEAGHQVGLYPLDFAAPGASPAVGSIMETGVSVDTLGREIRMFSEEDALLLQQKLNEPTEIIPPSGNEVN